MMKQPFWQMLLSSIPEEIYCVKTQVHSAVRMGKNIICYRCMLLLGTSPEPKLGSLLDY
jgi:hypothetical protein